MSTLTALLIAMMAQQSIGAMQLGMTASDVQRDFPTARVVDIEGQPGVTMVHVEETRRVAAAVRTRLHGTGQEIIQRDFLEMP